MLERKLFDELPGNHRFHSCIHLTFSFDFHHFEAQVLRMLKTKGVSNVSVFADSKMLDEGIGVSTGNIHAISSSYSLNGIHSKGAFHSKISFFAGDDQLLVLFGSGNLSNGGLGKNHELFTGLYASDTKSTQLPLIREIWGYIRDLLISAIGIPKEQLDWVTENNNLLDRIPRAKHQFYQIDEDISLALLYNKKESNIYNQLLQLVPVNDISEINIFCPFYDKDGKFLQNLKTDYNQSTISVYLPQVGGNPPNEIPDISGLSFYQWDDVERAKLKLKRQERKLHAKVFHFRAVNAEYLIVGSPNATIPAFGDKGGNSKNEEFAVLYKFPKDADILTTIGLIAKNAISVNPNRLIRSETDREDFESQIVKSIRIEGADRTGRNITVYISKRISEKCTFEILNQWGEVVHRNNVKPTNETAIKYYVDETVDVQEICYLQAVNEEGLIISNKQMINNYNHLIRTNPSEENLQLLRFENKIETDDWDDLDIITFFSTIKYTEIDKTENQKPNSEVVAKSTTAAIRQKLSNVSYEEARLLINDSELHGHLSNNHHTVRIWDSIYGYFSRMEEKQQEEDMGDEDEGDIVKGKDKVNHIKKLNSYKFSSEAAFTQKKEKNIAMVKNYLKALDKTENLCKGKMDIIDVCKFLIITKTLIGITQREVVYQEKVKIDGREKTKSISDEFLPIFGKYNVLDNLTSIALAVIGKFTRNAIKSNGFEQYKDSFQSKKMEKYKELTFVYSVFLLATIQQYHKQKGDAIYVRNWLLLLYQDLFLLFGHFPNFKTEFEKLKKYTSIKNFDADIAIDNLNYWKTPNQKAVKLIYFHNKLGHCNIEKLIPANSPLFIKVSKPGLNESEGDDDFVFHKLINLKTGEMLNSKQQLLSKNKYQ